jgi:D-alanyl-D-alanine carboxypeptidase/D-alanyl-D-alanine-endopeptidase (penicillin-binding protein 4)
MPNDRRLPRRLSLCLVALLALAGCNQTASTQPTDLAAKSATSNIATKPAFPTQPLTIAPGATDAQTTTTIQQYLKKLLGQGYPDQVQGIWIQTSDQLLSNHQGTTPLSAASLTKVATSLAALQTFGVDHRFETLFGTTGAIENGVLKGDLIIEGNNNPFFVWEDAIAVGNALNQLGVKKVTGNLVIAGQFFMNYESDLTKSGTLLKQSFDAANWSGEVAQQYATLPPGTPKPQIAIAGKVLAGNAPADLRTMLRHKSEPLPELLKKMNRFSNNPMAEMIANAAGGPQQVAQKAAQAAGVPVAEIQLVNGSGLSPDNRISPRAVCSMFLALSQYLQPLNMTIADLFTVVGKDSGILDGRKLPPGLVTKSGSLNAVSALAGAMPTQQKGLVWFVIMNGGGENLEGFRADQEALLRSLSAAWGPATPPAELAVHPDRAKMTAVIEKVN